MSNRIQVNLQRTYNEVLETHNEYNTLIAQQPAPWSPQLKVEVESLLQLLKQSHNFMLQSLDKWEDLAKKIKDPEEKRQEYEALDTWRDTEDHRKLLKELAKTILKGDKYLLLEYDDTNISINSTQSTNGTNINVTVPHTNSSVFPQMLRIPSLNIQKFNGNYLKWKPFWQRFEINVHNHPFSNVEKLDALIGLLEGDALDEVAGFEIAGENYDTVVNTLAKRFGNPKLVLKELYHNLRSIQPSTSDAKSLRSTVNTITNMCRQLQNYGVNIDNDALQSEIVDKMPPREKHELSWFQIKTENVTTEMLLEKMKEIALKAEICPQNDMKTSTTYSPPPEQNKRYPNTNQISQYSNNDVGSSNKMFVCSFCDQDHSSYNCPKFVSTEARIQQLQRKHCCTKCTKSNHSTEQCQSDTKCRSCHGQHYTFLCNQRDNSNKSSKFQPLDNRFIENSSIKTKETKAFVTLERQQGCLLAKEVTVTNHETKHTAKAVAFFDSGSQRSYISNKLIH
uniref:Peptidase aspartic putative domain-containing protein n=1 Tax=Panagrolaimus sp. PS1159 TaxID=55785 RepID=A0AC35F206_9BILA